MQQNKEKNKEKKAFVLDTNVILHDYTCIRKFEEHDVIIPTVVLEELDKFKKGGEAKNYNARKFIIEIDGLRQYRINKKVNKQDKNLSALCNGGVSLGPGKGNIEIKNARKVPNFIKDTYPEDIADNRILGMICDMEKDNQETRKLIFVTKDVNLRIKADSLNIEAEDYENDKVNASDIYLGRATIETYPTELIDSLYAEGKSSMDGIGKFYKEQVHPNMFFILKNDKKSGLARFDSVENMIVRVEKKEYCGIIPRNSEQIFATNALWLPDIKIVSLSGFAGTGKTLLAMAVGLELLKQKKYEQIIIASAIVPLSNKDVGFLPGDINDKVSPFMQGIFDNLDLIKNQAGKKDSKWVDDMISHQKDGRIKIQPLASIRGRSLNNTYFVVDEVQNTTPHEVKTITTRAGENTKIVFCGDVSQIDSPYLGIYSNGLSHLSRLKGQDFFAHITLEKGERSIVADICSKVL